MSSSTNQTYTAEYFTNWTRDRLDQLQVLPPYEPKDKPNQAKWVRGSIRNVHPDGVLREFTVTGPKMRVCYNGCNWNRIVFAMNGAADQEVYNFERWARSVGDKVKDSIFSDPGKFKPGAINSSRFMFDDDFIKPASNPAVYPDEMRVRLSTKRVRSEDGVSFEDVADADLFTKSTDGEIQPVLPCDVTAGSYIVPVLKFSYYRNIEDFGLVVTLLRGVVYPGDNTSYRVTNEQWTIDYPMDV